MAKTQPKPPVLPRGFGSDNFSGIHPDILAAIASANSGHARAYGDDPFTRAAEAEFRRHFGPGLSVFFVFNGTAANVLSLAAATRSYHSVYCAEGAHLWVDESGAPEKFTGCKLVQVPAPDGKITVERLTGLLGGEGNPHRVQPRVLSFSQPTELGTVYSLRELRKLTRYAHGRGLLVHMDGARLANAAARLGVPMRAITAGSGVDMLSFGGTKNGLMCGEAVVLFKAGLAKGFPNLRKQSMQLASKMRFISAQFAAYLSGDLWLRNARHANRMADLLASLVRDIPGVELAQAVEANSLFARIPKAAILPLQEKFFFWIWNEAKCEVRWMCSFDTREEDIRAFARELRAILARGRKR